MGPAGTASYTVHTRTKYHHDEGSVAADGAGGMAMAEQYRKVRVLVESSQRAFRGIIHQPVTEENLRFSDYINTYPNAFISLTEAQVTERGQHYRVGDKQDYIAISVSAITYITVLDEK
jgi:hypothetical protein